MTRLPDCAKEDEVLGAADDDEVHRALRCLRVSSSEGDKWLIPEAGETSLGNGVSVLETV